MRISDWALRGWSRAHATPLARRSASWMIHATSGIALDVDGNVLWSKRPDLPVQGRSTVKLLTALAVRSLLDLDQPVTVDAADDSPHSDVHVGQTLAVADLLAACLIHSDNTATTALARTAGCDRTLAAMRDLAPPGWVITDPRGFGHDNRVTARGMVCLLRHIASTDPWLHDIAGRLDHGIPGYVAGKSGTDGDHPTSDAYLVWSWNRPGGTTATGALMGTDKRNRLLDVTALQRRVG